MELIFQNEVFECNPLKQTELEETLLKINEQLMVNKLVFSHFLVAGIPVYSSFEDIVEEYGHKEFPIEIVGVSRQEWITDLKMEGYDYIKRGYPHIDRLINQLYSGEETKDAWNELGNLSEGLQYLYGILEHIEIEDKFVSLPETFEQLLEAMDNEDLTLIADLLSYELLPIFKQLEEVLKVEGS